MLAIDRQNESVRELSRSSTYIFIETAANNTINSSCYFKDNKQRYFCYS